MVFLAAALDGLVIAAAFAAACLLQGRLLGRTLDPRYFWYVVPFSALFLFLLHRYGLYGSQRYDPAWTTVRRVLSAAAWAAVLSGAALYLAHAGGFSRSFFGLFLLLAAGALVAEKILIRWIQGAFRRRGRNLRHVLVAGRGERFRRLLDWIAARPQLGIRVVEAVDWAEGDVLERVRRLFRRRVVDEVFVALDRGTPPGPREVRAFLRLCEEFGKVTRVLTAVHEETGYARMAPCRLGEWPALCLYSLPLDPDLLLLKRWLDVTGALVGLAATAVLFPAIALAIKLDSPGPVLFRQVRVGRNGRRFRILKFRTMIADAERRKAELLDRNHHDGPIFKVPDDPRVTRVGRFLRRTSLDELPQFWNVLKGEMSLVGTRPPTPEEVVQYAAWHYRRISIRPGITGLWQVCGRNRIRDFDRIVRLDLYYISNWSFWLDVRLILRTLRVLFVPGRNGGC
nr:sugar transferase [Dissulfurirhabdus thermomarina]